MIVLLKAYVERVTTAALLEALPGLLVSMLQLQKNG
jgi:hypothetical protein